jgi:thiol-disulfide isomerase/thioredoxin
MKNSLLILSAAIVALLAGIATHVWRIQHLDVPATINWNTQLPDEKDKPHTLAEWHGKLLVVNFWATWCPPCLKEIPTFIQLQQQFANNNVQFLGIAVDNKTDVLQYKTTLKMNYPTLIAGDSGGMALAKEWGNSLSIVPYTVVVNAQGQIVEYYVGEVSQNELREVLLQHH